MKFKMGLFVMVFALSMCVFNCASQQIDQTKVHLSVYYESLCRDSAKFIVYQLLPVMRILELHLRVKLIPFGKAKSINEGFGGFECQHGENECYGNMVQDCSLYQMANRSDLDKIKYVACEMVSRAGANHDYKCVRQAKVPVQLVKQCILNGNGTQLQLLSEYLTQQVTGPPYPKFIPTITYNLIFNQDVQDDALVDLLGILCANLKESKPCATLYNQMALEHLFSPKTSMGFMSSSSMRPFH